MIKDFNPRLYQQTILATASNKNTLVVLPTGLGKTYIFLMLAAQRISKFPDSKILMLGPTKPLINQYYNLFLKHLDIDEKDLAIFTGQVKPEKRQELWEKSKIIFSTPQGLENDIISNKISLKDVSLICFDEAHRAIGDYSYVWIAKQYNKQAKNDLILALTASPGSNAEKIADVCKNLYIKDVEIRTDDDPDVKPYIKEINIKWVHVELPTYFSSVLRYLKNCYKSKIELIKQYVKLSHPVETKRDILALQGQLLSNIKEFKDIESMKAISLLAEAMKIQHAQEMLESQGVTPLLDYMEELVSKAKTTKTKAVKNLVADLNFKSALILARNLKESKIEHPKYDELKKILKENKNKKIIIFSQYRDSISNLVKEIKKLDIKVEMFVGQQKKKGTGLSQKQQISLIEKFKNDEFNVLVMSSVGEEGLDIPSVDMVIFYEPVPSAIRTIQRRGRTGRQDKGEVIVLIAKNTRDEGYRWSSHHKEKRMNTILKQLKTSFSIAKKETTLTEFIVPDEGITVYADYREKSSGVIKKLIDLGIQVNLKKLDVGDYLVSDELCIEYKTVPDFIDSLIDKRLFTQLKSMKKYRKQLIILEGTEDLYTQRKLHPNAIRGMLTTVSVGYGVPIIQTKNSNDTALMLAMIAKKEQSNDKKEFTLHSIKPLTLKEQQEYLISALPGIGPILSKPMLNKFKSVKNILNASIKQLKDVELIGEKKASKIREIIDSDYKED
ncbi:DEAD/DEAH box helicase [archaeon]|jgi:ERCC4-related helicase|nr:DEAD/DEAH box helicase [archaeon]MBT4022266.1 DEAD/DEAH box helicase [archaeon]MBT4272930.1 DEAD/DEAH box helicase [archaeon]MBT4460673.1 DEAD/DEAH box helicase [archaeon]MBT4857961.1 DEAD/DEAH box helicase [archaeon]